MCDRKNAKPENCLIVNFVQWPLYKINYEKKKEKEKKPNPKIAFFYQKTSFQVVQSFCYTLFKNY